MKGLVSPKNKHTRLPSDPNSTFREHAKSPPIYYQVFTNANVLSIHPSENIQFKQKVAVTYLTIFIHNLNKIMY